MKVDVSLCGVLRHRERAGGDGKTPGEGQVELAEGATLSQLAARLGLERELGWVAFVNGKPVWDDRSLNDGDEVYLFLPVSGG